MYNPHMQSTCVNCSNAFDITSEDEYFYEQLSPIIDGKKYLIPLPTHCPDCRLQRRMAYRNQIYVYSRQSSSTKKPIFSLYTEQTSFPVIDKDEWWSDAFDATIYGRDFDFSRPFFEQFADLKKVVPHFSISVTNTENSEYCNNGSELKNCYLVFNTSGAEDCMNGEGVWYSKDCLDCYQTVNSELCYDCTDCSGCYNLQSSEGCANCSDSLYLLNCRSCKHCFGCVNLRNKEYCIFGEQHTKEEYEKKMQDFDLSSYSQRTAIAEKIEQYLLGHPRPHIRGNQIEDSTGDSLTETRNVQESYFIQQAEHVKFGCYLNKGSKDCMDHTLMGIRSELLYECSVCGYDSQCLRFCYNCWISNAELMYCWLCRSTSNCFGSISLKKKRFCILNKQYTEEEYKLLVPKIIEHMRQTKEWGEFFPLALAPTPYNRSLAQRFFPKDEQAVTQQGLEWYQETPPISDVIIESQHLPDRSASASESITTKSALSGRPFRISAQEIKRCQQINVPLPRTAYDERMEARARKLGGVHLYVRQCAKTGKNIMTTYPPDTPWIIWDKEEYDRVFG